MAEINFYLKKPNQPGKTPIYLFLSYDGQRLKFGTGESIEPAQWNSEKQRVRKSFIGNTELNDYLEKVAQTAFKIYRDGKIGGVKLTPQYIRDALMIQLNKKVECRKTFFECYKEFIRIGSATKQKNTIKHYTTVMNHLIQFERKYKCKLAFDKIDISFYDNLVEFYINGCKHFNNTISKNIEILKTFLKWATERDHNSNMTFMKFNTSFKDRSDTIHLTESELMSLYSAKLKNKRLSDVRDVFCFGCFTGLRFSDIAGLRKENIINDELNFVTQKTKDHLIIPLSEYAKEILLRHNFKLPVISNQKTNEYLKEIGEASGIDDIVIRTKYRGAEKIEYQEPKYNYLCTHTCRRTFVTLSLEKGMRMETVMAITGHKDFKSFKKYIKITSNVKLKEMNRTWFKEPVLKAV